MPSIISSMFRAHIGGLAYRLLRQAGASRLGRNASYRQSYRELELVIEEACWRSAGPPRRATSRAATLICLMLRAAALRPKR